MDDFTANHYEEILKRASAIYRFESFDNFHDSSLSGAKIAFWRHDVDHSVHRALALAKIERESCVKSTYFFHFGSFFYNIFEQEIKEIIFEIGNIGHNIGLHFDPTQYPISTKNDLEQYLLFEKNILEKLLNVEVKVFSFHNPTSDILKYDDICYCDMVNTYSRYFKENVEYCSDSNGYWRFKTLEDFLDEGYPKIQVLTHPAWWQKEPMSPRDRVHRCIEGRAIKQADKYDDLLKQHGRQNIG